MPLTRIADADAVAPGQSLAVIVMRRELALFNLDGQFYCIDNLCPHADGPLADGFIEGENVICPWHMWTFQIKTGQMLYNDRVCVDSFPCTVQDGGVFIEVPG